MAVDILFGMGDVNLEDCKQMQSEEWEVLEVSPVLSDPVPTHQKQSIYPECVTSDISSGLIKLEINVDLGGPRMLLVADDGSIPAFSPANEPRTAPDPTKSPETGATVSSLPHILIQLILPPNYPSHAPPNIVSIRAKYSWCNRLPDLQRALLEMWNEGEGVLYDWIEFVRTGTFLHQDGPHKPIKLVLFL